MMRRRRRRCTLAGLALACFQEGVGPNPIPFDSDEKRKAAFTDEHAEFKRALDDALEQRRIGIAEMEKARAAAPAPAKRHGLRITSKVLRGVALTYSTVAGLGTLAFFFVGTDRVFPYDIGAWIAMAIAISPGYGLLKVSERMGDRAAGRVRVKPEPKPEDVDDRPVAVRWRSTFGAFCGYLATMAVFAGVMYWIGGAGGLNVVRVLSAIAAIPSASISVVPTIQNVIRLRRGQKPQKGAEGLDMAAIVFVYAVICTLFVFSDSILKAVAH